MLLETNRHIVRLTSHNVAVFYNKKGNNVIRVSDYCQVTLIIHI